LVSATPDERIGEIRWILMGSEAKHAEAKHAEAKHTEAKHTEAKHAEAKHTGSS